MLPRALHRRSAARHLASARRALGALAALIALVAARPASAFCGFYVAGATAKLQNAATMVVLLRDGTRTVLHYRYDRDSAGEDLVFRAAPPIEGGTEDSTVTCSGELTWAPTQHGAKGGTDNRFQARYAMRHAWTGPMACASPVRGAWGGPPADAGASGPAEAAQGVAFAERKGVRLEEVVLTKVAGIEPVVREVRGGARGGVDGGVAVTAGGGAGCGRCAAARGGEDGGRGWWVVVVVGMVVRGRMLMGLMR
jgi:hypothetical protein